MNKSSLFLLSMLCASVALAEPPAPPTPPTRTQEAASELVEKRLLQPLRKAESKRKRFSRAAPVAKERRVRVLDLVARADVRGKQFVRFAVDQRFGWSEDGEWETDVFVGCAYLDQKRVFVRRGDEYVPASSAVGGDDRARADVCRAAPQSQGQLASAAR